MNEDFPRGSITSLAVANYRSLREIILPLEGLNVVYGANGSGKSNLYRALRLLAGSASSTLLPSLARDGGLRSVLWAGPQAPSRAMRRAEVPVQGGPQRDAVRLRLGFAGDDFGYSVALGLPDFAPQVVLPDGSRRVSHLARDPQIKHECIWAGPVCRPASMLVERRGPLVRVRDGRRWEVLTSQLNEYDSMFTALGNMHLAPEVLTLRERIRRWRFYDQMRTDEAAPARQPQVATRTTALSDDGHDVAAAIETIREIGDHEAFDRAIDHAFAGARVEVASTEAGWLRVQWYQPGLLRPLEAAELSDGTLRYLLLTAALLTPRPPPLLVLNEPETSLHPDLLPALARQIADAARRSQVWVVSHASRLVHALENHEDTNSIALEREAGETRVGGQTLLDQPPWKWPDAGRHTRAQ